MSQASFESSPQLEIFPRAPEVERLDPATVIGRDTRVRALFRVQYEGRERILWLQGAASGSVDAPVLCRVDVTLTPDAPFIMLDSNAWLRSEGDFAPDPTISGVVDFVLNEARAAGKR